MFFVDCDEKSSKAIGFWDFLCYNVIILADLYKAGCEKLKQRLFKDVYGERIPYG